VVSEFGKLLAKQEMGIHLLRAFTKTYLSNTRDNLDPILIKYRSGTIQTPIGHWPITVRVLVNYRSGSGETSIKNWSNIVQELVKQRSGTGQTHFIALMSAFVSPRFAISLSIAIAWQTQTGQILDEYRSNYVLTLTPPPTTTLLLSHSLFTVTHALALLNPLPLAPSFPFVSPY
jgi:hypothetical protein